MKSLTKSTFLLETFSKEIAQSLIMNQAIEQSFNYQQKQIQREYILYTKN